MCLARERECYLPALGEYPEPVSGTEEDPRAPGRVQTDRVYCQPLPSLLWASDRPLASLSISLPIWDL